MEFIKQIVKHFIRIGILDLRELAQAPYTNLSLEDEKMYLLSGGKRVVRADTCLLIISIFICFDYIRTSEDIDRIDSEVIESVKFKFVSNRFKGKITAIPQTDNILDLDKLQSGSALFNSEEELVEYMLKNKNVKHYRQLIFLVKNHKSSILKIRFVLHPFSFIFLLEGQSQFHLVMETLDTEEATYIWHIDKQELRPSLSKINQDLNLIRNKGRQLFLENQPENFSKIMHDYFNERKGFIIWKDSLDERLT